MDQLFIEIKDIGQSSFEFQYPALHRKKRISKCISKRISCISFFFTLVVWRDIKLCCFFPKS